MSWAARLVCIEGLLETHRREIRRREPFLAGAVVGGVLLGLIESIGAGYIGDLTGGVLGSHYSDIFAFIVLIAVLTLRPSGLLGERVADQFQIMRIELNRDEFKVGSEYLQRFRPRLQIDASPSRALGNLSFSIASGSEIDFDNGREGTGTNLSASGTWRPENHTTVSVATALRWLDVDAGSAG